MGLSESRVGYHKAAGGQGPLRVATRLSKAARSASLQSAKSGTSSRKMNVGKQSVGWRGMLVPLAWDVGLNSASLEQIPNGSSRAVFRGALNRLKGQNTQDAHAASAIRALSHFDDPQ